MSSPFSDGTISPPFLNLFVHLFLKAAQLRLPYNKRHAFYKLFHFGLISTSLMTASFLFCAMWNANSSLYNIIVTSLMTTSFTCHLCDSTPIKATSLHLCTLCDTDSSLNTIMLHPVWLHCFLLAPCVIQTPPLTTILSHPLMLHNFFLSTFAPCVFYQLHPSTAPLPHPLALHRFFTLCVIHTPFLTTSLVIHF